MNEVRCSKNISMSWRRDGEVVKTMLIVWTGAHIDINVDIYFKNELGEIH